MFFKRNEIAAKNVFGRDRFGRNRIGRNRIVIERSKIKSMYQLATIITQKKEKTKQFCPYFIKKYKIIKKFTKKIKKNHKNLAFVTVL